MSAPDRLVRRYARALFEASREAEALPEVARDLERLTALVGEEMFAASFFDPSVDREAKRRAFEEKAAGFGPIVRRFVSLLLDRRREAVLENLAGAFAAEADRAAGIVRGVVESAAPLEPVEIGALEAALGRSLGRTVRLVPRVESDLGAGVRLEVGGRRLDATVPGRLAQLRERLLAVPLVQG